MPRLIRVPLTPLLSGEHALPDAAGRYAARVHRLGAGDRLELFDPLAGSQAAAEVVRVERQRVICLVGEVQQLPDSARLPLRVVQGLGKGDKPEGVVRDATALGAAEVVLLQTERVQGRRTQTGEHWQRRLQTVAIEAARQSGRARIPDIRGPYAFADWLPEVDERSLLLDPRGSIQLFSALAELFPPHEPLVRPVSLLIGPEGGFTHAEQAEALARGARQVRFGQLILRTETALTAVLGAALAWFEARGRAV